MGLIKPIDEKKIRVHGRTVMADPLPIFWTAGGVEFITDGSYLDLTFETSFSVYEQWIRVTVDEYTMIRMPLPKGRYTLRVYQGMNAGEKRTVRVFKECQAMPDPESYLLFHGLEADGELYELPAYDKRFEFIGDSITSGEGMAGTKGTSFWNSSVFSTKDHYAVAVAKAFNADLHILSQSGWGTYCSWDNNPHNVMPTYYEQVCGVVPGENYERLGAHQQNDFTWQPDVIVVNLGTNDCGAFTNQAFVDEDGTEYKQFKNPDDTYNEGCVKLFTDAVYAFLQKLRKNNPESHIIWCYGMLGWDFVPVIQETIDRYKKDTGDAKVELLPLPDLTDEGTGANGHPGVGSHKAAADTIIARIKAL